MMSQTTTPMLLIFEAEWSSTSSMTTVIISKIENEAKNIKLISIDIDSDEKLALQYRINKVPTCVLLINNELKFRYEGMFSKSKILQELKKHA